MTRLAVRLLARRRAVAVLGIAALAGTLLVAAGVAHAQTLPTLNITPKTRTVNENAGTITFTATLSRAYAASTGTDVTFYYYLRGDDQADHEATSGEDFDHPTGFVGPVTITAGNRSTTFQVRIIDDALDEFDEGFVLEPNSLTNAEPSASMAQYYDEEETFLRGHYVTTTIRDNDDPPVLRFTPSDEVTTESGRFLRYQLSLSEPSGRQVRVPYEVLPGLARNSNGVLIDEDDCGPFTERDVCQPATPVEDYGPSDDDETWSDNGTPNDTTDDVLQGEFVFEPGETRTEPDSAFDHPEISINVVNDTTHDVNDRDETLTVRLKAGATYVLADGDDGIREGLILDDDLPRVSISQYGAGHEVDAPASMGVSASDRIPSGQTVTVGYRWVEDVSVTGWYRDDDPDRPHDDVGLTVDCTATEGEDYEGDDGTLTFASTDRFKRVEYMRLDDEIAESNERICLELYYPDPDPNVENPPPPNFLLNLSPVWHEILLDNEDPPVVEVGSLSSDGMTCDSSPPSADEGETLTFCVRFTRSESPERLHYATENVTAVEPGDYTARSGTLSFGANDTKPQTVRVTTRNDTLDEPDESLKLVIKDETNSHTLAEVRGTIRDTDGEPSLTVADVRADEDDGTLEFTVRLSPASGKEVTVSYQTADGTGTTGATAPDDYASAGNVLTFAPGTREIEVPVTIVDDTLWEGNETFTLTLSSAGNATIGRATATGTIVDDEEAPSIRVADAQGPESGGSLEFEVTIGSQSGSTVTVDYTTGQLTGSDKATSGADCNADGADFAEASDTLTFDPGDVTLSVFVTLCQDNLDEEDETFRLTLSNASGAPIGDSNATGTIEDSDDPPSLTFQNYNVAVDEDVASGSIDFVVQLSTASAKVITVKHATTDGSATSPADFAAPLANATLTFAPGITEQTIALQIKDDTLDEEDTEDFTLTLREPTNATLRQSDATATGTINDNDDPPALSVTGGTAREDATRNNPNSGVTFTVRLDAESGRDVSVDYATEVSGTDTATSDLDFTETSGRLIIRAGQRSGTVTVPVLDDTIDEPNETFTLRLSGESNATLDAADSTATGTITDDNDPATDLRIENVTVNEGSGTATFTVTLAAESGQEVTVEYETVEHGSGTGRATSGADCDADGADFDFEETSGTLTFPANSLTPTEGDPTVTICDDDIDEHDEAFGLRLKNPSNATAPPDPATGLIEDNDNEPDLSVDDPRESEAVRNIEFTVTLNRPSGKQVRVDYMTMDVDAEEGKDYTPKRGTLVFDPGETTKKVPVPVNNDEISEDDETFTQMLTNPDNATANDDSGTATIVDNDGEPGLRVNDPGAVRERPGAKVRFTVTLEPVSSSTVTVEYGTADGTATAGDDYVATDGTLTFDPGDKTKTVEVDLVSDDDDEEDDETFTLVLSNQDPLTVDLDDDTGEATITERRVSSGGGGGGGGGGGDGEDEDEDGDEDEEDDETTTQQLAAPRIGVSLNDVVLYLNEPPIHMDLLASIVGHVEAYRALAANPGIVTAIISGSKLTLSPVALGVTTVSVSATNGRGSAFQTFRVTVIERGAPRLSSFLADLVLYVGDPPTVVNVGPAFGGTVQSYRATAGDPRLVTVVLSGSNVSLSGLTPGVTTVSILARNVNGVTLQTFRVTVRIRPAPGTDPGPQQEIPTH